MNLCKRHICVRYRAAKPFAKSRYADGQRFCMVCDIFMHLDGGIYCPCCGHKTRGKPRYGKYRQLIEVGRY